MGVATLGHSFIPAFTTQPYAITCRIAYLAVFDSDAFKTLGRRSSKGEEMDAIGFVVLASEAAMRPLLAGVDSMDLQVSEHDMPFDTIGGRHDINSSTVMLGILVRLRAPIVDQFKAGNFPSFVVDKMYRGSFPSAVDNRPRLPAVLADHD